jgi:UDP-N-acetylenolpyruvoylglucosamine reductase
MDFIEELTQYIPDNMILRDESMVRHTTIRLGGPVSFYIQTDTIERLIKAVLICRAHDVPYIIEGRGSNLIFTDKGFKGAVIRTAPPWSGGSQILINDLSAVNADIKTSAFRHGEDKASENAAQHDEDKVTVNASRLDEDKVLKCGDQHDITSVQVFDLESFTEDFFINMGYPVSLSAADLDVVVIAGAGAGMASFAKTCADHSLTGAECLSGIPGSIGGAVVMNAGAYGGEIKDIIIGAKVLTPLGNIAYLDKARLDLSYRHSSIEENGCIVLSAAFGLKKGKKQEIIDKMNDLNSRRRQKQPLDMPSAGSTFKRPVVGYAAQLIEESGLKGIRIGDMMISDKHAGFIINAGNGTYAEAMKLIDHVQKTVFEKKGILLEPEVRIEGDR